MLTIRDSYSALHDPQHPQYKELVEYGGWSGLVEQAMWDTMRRGGVSGLPVRNPTVIYNNTIPDGTACAFCLRGKFTDVVMSSRFEYEREQVTQPLVFDTMVFFKGSWEVFYVRHMYSLLGFVREKDGSFIKANGQKQKMAMLERGDEAPVDVRYLCLRCYQEMRRSANRLFEAQWRRVYEYLGPRAKHRTNILHSDSSDRRVPRSLDRRIVDESLLKVGFTPRVNRRSGVDRRVKDFMGNSYNVLQSKDSLTSPVVI